MFDQSLIEVDNIESVSSVLAEYGVCIVKNIMNENECNQMVEKMANTFEYLTADLDVPFQFSDPSTWNTLEELGPIRHMLHHHYSIGQAQFVWDIRCNPHIVQTFAKLWNTEDLLVSFDGLSYSLPPEITKAKGAWHDFDHFHTDQSFVKEGLHCIQGMINGYDTNKGDATLVTLIGSHKYHYQYGQHHHNYSTHDFASIKDVNFFLERGCIHHRLTFPRGSLVLWDSRTIHYGGEPLPLRREPNFRAIVYLCYTPRALITEEKRQIKMRCFEEMKTTNHWPHDPRPFADFQRYCKAKDRVRKMPRPVIPPQYLSLIGYYEGEYEDRMKSREEDEENLK